MKIWIGDLAFILNLKRDRLEFQVNVKGFWILFVMREKAKYFYVTEFRHIIEGIQYQSLISNLAFFFQSDIIGKEDRGSMWTLHPSYMNIFRNVSFAQ